MTLSHDGTFSMLVSGVAIVASPAPLRRALRVDRIIALHEDRHANGQ